MPVSVARSALRSGSTMPTSVRARTLQIQSESEPAHRTSALLLGLLFAAIPIGILQGQGSGRITGRITDALTKDTNQA
jgi:hypothetical protein